MAEAIDDDLRDVFKLLYEGDDWAFEEDDEGGDGSAGETAGREVVPATIDVGDLGVLDQPREATVDVVEAEVSIPTTQERYTRKRFLSQLDSLLSPSTPSSTPSKRPRIFSTPSRASSSTSTSTSSHIIPSTVPLPPLPSTSTYAPFSPLSLLSRLRTFHPSLYSPSIPYPISPSDVALAGWTNVGRDEQGCGVCGAKWDLKGVSEISDERVRREVARRLGEKGEKKGKHVKGCAWKLADTPVETLVQIRKMLHPPLASSLAALALALQRGCQLFPDLKWKSPLTPEQSSSLTSKLRRYAQSPAPTNSSASTAPAPSPSPSSAITALSAALALFAWYPFHPNSPHTHGNVESPAESSPSSFLSSPSPSSTTDQPHQTEIVQCRICERRVGLWGFTAPSPSPSASASTSATRPPSDRRVSADSTKVFDLLEEHFAWCPIRSQSRSDVATGGADAVSGAWWDSLPILAARRSPSSSAQTSVVLNDSSTLPILNLTGQPAPTPASVTDIPSAVKGSLKLPQRGWVSISSKLKRKSWWR